MSDQMRCGLPMPFPKADRVDKGAANGSCNRTACQVPLGHEPRHQFMEGNFTGGPRLHYCAACAKLFDDVDDDLRRRGQAIWGRRITREDKTPSPTPDRPAASPQTLRSPSHD